MQLEGTGKQEAVGVFYLAWGRREEPLDPLRTFVKSYKAWNAGVPHTLFILFKGFPNATAYEAAREVLADVNYESIHVDEAEWDIGSYFVGAALTKCDFVCFLNTYSEILCHSWLEKLVTHLGRRDIGLVGCSGSYETARHPNVHDNVPFPNPHLRSNAFALRRDRFLRLKPRTPLLSKLGTHLFEHGTSSLSRCVVSEGLKVLVVGRNGRGYDVAEWPRSGTFRQARQSNLIVADNRTRDYDKAPIAEKRSLFRLAWGDGSHGHVELAPARPTSPDEDYVRAAYGILLGRVPHQTEVDGWVMAIRDGMTVDDFVRSTLRSTEGQARRAVDPDVHILFA